MRRIAIALCACFMILLSIATVPVSAQSIVVGHAYGGTGYDFGSAVAADSSGNVYIVGFSTDAGDWTAKAFLAKFSPSGSLLWSKEITSLYSSDTQATEVAIAGSGDIYVVGQMNDYGGPMVFAAKFTPDGALLWSRGLMNLTYPESLAIDPSTDGFVIAANLQQNWEGVIAAFDADGDWNWMSRTSDASPYGVAVDADGNTYAFSDRYTDGSYVGLTKFDIAGNVIAQKVLSTTSANEISWDLGLTPDGYLVALGTQYGDLYSQERALIAKLDSSLSPIWTKTISSTEFSLDGYRVGLPTDGSVYAMCRGYGGMNYTNATAIIRLDSSGNLISDAVYGGQIPGMFSVSDVAPLPSGGLLLGGVSYGTPPLNPESIQDLKVQSVNGTWINDNLNWISDRIWLQGDSLSIADVSPPVDDFSYEMMTQAWWGAVDLPAPGLSVALSSLQVGNLTYSFSADISGGTAPYNYLWSFGDGYFSNSSAPTHTFNSAGLWWVQLAVEDSAGLRGMAYVQIAVPGPPIIADFQVYPESGAVGNWFYFYVDAFDPEGGAITDYVWDFGDNYTSYTSVPYSQHSYQWAGVFNATVSVTDSDGEVASKSLIVTVLAEVNEPPYAYFSLYPSDPAVGTNIEFYGGSSGDYDGWIVSYVWDFGDNMTGTGEFIYHAYQSIGYYYVTLTVTDNDGASSSYSRLVYVSENLPPVANFTWSPLVPTPGEPVMFNTYGTYDPDGWIAYYLWDFGDGNYSYADWNYTVWHQYYVGGSYNVTLTVIDNRGAETSVTKLLRVDLPPVAVISASYPGKVGTPMQFDGSGSYDPDGSVVRYHWDFGDGGWAEGMDVSHVYAEPGTYSVYLVVMDDAGSWSDTALSVSVLTPKPPVAVIGYSPYPVVIGAACTFDANASLDPDGSISTCIWQFGDGSTAKGLQATHVYRYAGQYEVRLVVIDEDGLSAETTVTLTVMASRPKTADVGSGIVLGGTPVVPLAGAVAIVFVIVIAGTVPAAVLLLHARSRGGKAR